MLARVGQWLRPIPCVGRRALLVVVARPSAPRPLRGPPMDNESMNGLFAGLTSLDVIHALDHVPDPTVKVTSTDHVMAAGGPATNAAIAFAALERAAGRLRPSTGAAGAGNARAEDGDGAAAPGAGALEAGAEGSGRSRAVLLSALGAGAAAEFLRADLAEAGVRLVDATAASNSSGPAVSGIIEHPGGRMVASTNARVEVDPALARRALESMQHLDVVLVDGHNPRLAQSALTAGTHPATDPDDPFAELEARPAHLRVLDGGSWKDWFTPLLGLVDVAVVSADFAPPLLRAPDGAQVAGFLRGFGITRTVRTQGPGPVQFWWDGRSGEVEVEPVDAASTLGAGDAFHGAFAWGCARSRRVGAPISDPRGLIRFASAVARVSVASFGTRRWLSSPELQRCVESFVAGPSAEPGGPGGAPGR